MWVALICSMTGLVLLSACSTQPPSQQNEKLQAMETTLGALAMTQDSSPQTLQNYPSLVSDHRALGPGQSIIVLIVEEASATTSADTRTAKSVDVAGQLERTNGDDAVGLGVQSDSVGSGAISRQGELVASVSATIYQVLPSGEMLIYGEQTIELNDETQYIRISGKIRPQDISSNNSVLSTRIAQAQITYKGDGLLGSRQKPGVITRLFNWIF